MGSIIEAVIQHHLSPKELLLLPELLNDFNIIGKKDRLEWTVPNINEAFLEKYWTKKHRDYMKRSWGIEDLGLLENKELSLHFYKSNLTSFNILLRADTYKTNPALKFKFYSLTKSIALKMRATDVIIIEDWYYDHAFNSDDSVDVIKQKLKNKNLSFCEIDLHS